ncbi:MAG: type II toxin-antitoxin system PemK/MazF family toxin [Pseudomonadota bacterium]
MSISAHVEKGALLWCDFNSGFKEPEMIKRRLVVAISPKIKARPNLCTVVALSTTPPDPIMPYHAQIDIHPPLPKRLQSNGVWVKGDMVYAVGFHRLELIRTRGKYGERAYYFNRLTSD